ncbi:MAG: HDIG domain-containing protein, partial [Tissierellia bacterium]|nr:HDIG domain-containing protein [Tissierellia bacterium]
MTRDQALTLLKEYNKTESLLQHAYAVEGVMRYFARKAGEDEDYWGNIGLLHDLDYELYPEQHCKMTEEILKEEGMDQDFINSIMSHGYGMCTDIEPSHYMEKVLYATDELTGLIKAACLMRPSKSVMDVNVKSINKKWKDKAFARGVDRDVIQDGIDR